MKPVRNVFYSLVGLGTRTIIQVVYFVLLARVLGPNDYGAFSSSLAVIYIFVPYATWGAGEILVKNVSRDRGKFSEYWGSVLLSIIIFGSVLLLLALLLYNLLLSEKVNVIPFLLLCLSELYFLRIIDTSLLAYQAFERMSRTALIQFVFSLTRLFFTSLFVFFIVDHSINTWAVLYLSSTIFASIFCLIIVRLELGIPRFVFSHITNNLIEGFCFSLSPSSQGIYNDFDKSILPKYTTLAITGNYSAAYKIIEALCVPIKAMLQTFYARFFIKGADGLFSSKKFSYKLFPVFFSYSVFALILLFSFSRYIPILFGSSYKDTVNIIQILSPLIIFRAIHSLGADTLTGAGMQGRRSVAQVLVAIINAVLCIILIPTKGWIGAAWASLISDGILVLLIWGIIFLSRSRTMTPLKSRIDKNEITPSSTVFN